MDCEANALIEPSVVGTIAIFDVTVAVRRVKRGSVRLLSRPMRPERQERQRVGGNDGRVEEIRLRIGRGITTAA